MKITDINEYNDQKKEIEKEQVKNERFFTWWLDSITKHSDSTDVDVRKTIHSIGQILPKVKESMDKNVNAHFSNVSEMIEYESSLIHQVMKPAKVKVTNQDNALFQLLRDFIQELKTTDMNDYNEIVEMKTYKNLNKVLEDIGANVKLMVGDEDEQPSLLKMFLHDITQIVAEQVAYENETLAQQHKEYVDSKKKIIQRGKEAISNIEKNAKIAKKGATEIESLAKQWIKLKRKYFQLFPMEWGSYDDLMEEISQ